MAEEVCYLFGGEGFDVAVFVLDTVDQPRRERMPLRYNNDKRKKPVFKGFSAFAAVCIFRRVSTTCTEF